MFYLAVASGLLSCLIIGNQWLAGVVLICWIFRVFLLKNSRIWWLTIIGSVFMAMELWVNQQNFKTARQQADSVTSQVVLIQPDQWNWNGERFMATGLINHQTVMLFGTEKSKEVRQQLQANVQLTQLKVKGSIGPVQSATNWGQFNPVDYYRGLGITKQFTIQSLELLPPPPRNQWQRIVDQILEWRAQFTVFASRLPPTLSLYATSLLTGVRPANFNQEMAGVRQLGLLHLFSLSGMHVVLLLGVCRWILTLGHVTKETSQWIMLIILPIYLVLGGGADSLRRATITIGLMLLTEKIAWPFPVNALTGWSWALIICLLLNPMVLIQLGGQLTFGLAWALMMGPIVKPWILSNLMHVLSLPLILYNTYQWHLLTLLANLIVVPLFSWCLLPITILGVVLAGLTKQVDGPVIKFCEWFLSNFQHLTLISGQAPGMITFGQPAVVFGWALGLTSLFVFAFPQRRWYWGALAGLYVGTFLLIHWPLQGEVTFIDIGQGDSTLIREPLNRSVTLIDTGGRLFFGSQIEGSRPPTPRVNTITLNYLHRLGISRLDTVCLTHQDQDHIGDLAPLLAGISVSRLVFPAGLESLPKFQKVVAPYLNKIQLMPVTAGQVVPGLPFKVLHPFQPGKATNEDSLVLQGQFGKSRFLFTGDLGQSGEHQLLARYPDLQVDVMKLGHHGSKTSSAADFLTAINTKMAIISAGRHNRYGHPSPETISTIDNLHLSRLITAENGMIRYTYSSSMGTWDWFLKGGVHPELAAGH